MKIIGIVAEYNPFHNGHLYHLEQARAKTGASHAIAVLSGNFVQRGEPAIIDKNARVLMALRAGVDVVVELPYMYALSSAGYFAGGAVSLLHNMGVVNCIAFGAEAKVNELEAVANILRREPQDFKSALRGNLSLGLSYPDARARALSSYDDSFDILKGPNNVLGIEYINSIARLGSKMSAVAIERTVPHIGGRAGRFASASEIRKSLLSGRLEDAGSFMPGFAVDILERAGAYHRLNNLSDVLHYRIRTQSSEELCQIAEISEGLENRITHFSRQFASLEGIISQVKTKRYTLSKIKRCFLNIILNVRKDTFAMAQKHGPAYVRILGFRKESQALLAYIEANSKIPMITNIKNAKHMDAYTRQSLESELRTTDIYALSADKQGQPRLDGREAEYKTPIVCY
ncbi:MAG: nucleotidyltransferase [Defluviitaleaceae bacterium]|nr:nucleotidyltransferase [Defluviitaleaceae bacterium]